MSTIALNNLWHYIQSLSLSNSNKDWLADKLIKSKSATMTDETQREELLYSMFGAWADDPEADVIEDAIKKRQTQ